MSDQPPSGQPPPSYQPPPPSSNNPLIPRGNQRLSTILSGISPRIWVGAVIGIVVIVVLLLLASQPRGTDGVNPTQIALEQTSTQNAIIFITQTFSAITPTIDAQVAALQTQNALQAQALTDQAATNQAIALLPTQTAVVITSTPQATIQPTQVSTATPLSPTVQPTQVPQGGGSGGVVTGQSGGTVCPSATNTDYQTPKTVTVTGRAIVHPWWNNNRPSWGQEQVRILLSPNETVTFIDMMGRVYTYQNTPACEAIMSQEFANANFRIVTVQDLVSQGLASTGNASQSGRCSPADVASLSTRPDATINNTTVTTQVRDTNACVRPLFYNETGIAKGANYTLDLPEGWAVITASVTAEIQAIGGQAHQYLETPVIVIHGPFKGGVGLYEGAIRAVPEEWVQALLADVLVIQREQTHKAGLQAITFSEK